MSERQTLLFSRLLLILVVALLGGSIAWWFWQFFAPRPVDVLTQERVDAASAVATVRSAGVFGRAPEGGPVAASLPDLKLIGVFAPTGSGPGFAVFNVDGRQNEAVVLGREIKPGASLVGLGPDHALVRHQGREVKVPLEDKGAGAAGSAAMAAMQGVPMPPQAPPAPPPELQQGPAAAEPPADGQPAPPPNVADPQAGQAEPPPSAPQRGPRRPTRAPGMLGSPAT